LSSILFCYHFIVNQAGTDELNIIVPEVKEENILHLYLLVHVAIRPLRAGESTFPSAQIYPEYPCWLPTQLY